MNKYKEFDSQYAQIINKNQDDESICYGYTINKTKQAVYYVVNILTVGIFLILFYWKPKWRLYATCSPSNLNSCTYVLIKDSHGQFFVEKVQFLTVPHIVHTGGLNIQNETSNYTEQQNHVRYFKFQMIRYCWRSEEQSFKKLHGIDYETRCVDILNDYTGYSAHEQQQELNYYGENSIEVKVKSYGRLFFEEILTPFYIFQIAACILWMLDSYYYYAACIVIISLISIILSLVETKRQAQTLHDMTQTHLKINVCRGNDQLEQIVTEQLVPGDIIELPSDHETQMACDAVLLNGTCIVNESMLTGESVPVIKSPLHTPENLAELYDVEIHKRNTLFKGTRIVQTRNYDNKRVIACVVRTGFSTSKGDLVRSILFPKPLGFKFYQDSLKFIGVLFIIALIGMTYGISILRYHGVDVGELIIRALDIVTIVVPPALPAAMTVGTVYAQSRLKTKSIFCISPPRINIGGKLKLICFDKTGTLTEDGLDLWGCVEVDQETHKFFHPTHHIEELHDGDLLRTLGTCHSLSRYDGALTGDPLDVKMFESTKWSFIDDHLPGMSKFEQVTPVVRQHRANQETDLEIAIVKQFTFSSSMLRMSVLCKALGADHLHVYTKGAPEKLKELCRPETIPVNFHESLKHYTANGYRVIALAGKPLSSELTWTQACKLSRDAIESELCFYGFLIMQNMIKPETTPVIRELKQAGLRTVMVTGDNLLTALNVARKCDLVPKINKVIFVDAHPPVEVSEFNLEFRPASIDWQLAEPFDDFDDDQANPSSYQSLPTITTVINMNLEEDTYNFAITGKSFAVLRKYFPKTFEKILLNGSIYARMSPDQKAQLVEHLISIGYCVSMCGDGANDCGALKAAHVGISLSEAEASVAAPFTSKVQNIKCVPEVIKEGRAALVTSFGVFKYMALYSMIQFCSVLILYAYLTNLSDPQFLYADLFIITPVAVFMSANKAYHKISPVRPHGSLVGFVNLSSIILQIILVAIFQVVTFFYAKQQPWFVPTNPNDPDIKKNSVSMEATTVFLISTFQYVAMAFVYSKGPPYRKPILDNVVFVITLIILTALNIFITLAPPEFVRKALGMKNLDPNHSFSMFRLNIVGLGVFFFLLSILLEEGVVDTKWYKKLGRFILRKKHPKNKYKMIKQDLLADKQWPFIDKTTYD